MSSANIGKLEEKSTGRAVLTALGIRFCGGSARRVFLAEAFGGLDRIASAGLEELQQAEEVGPKVALSISRFFSPAAPTGNWSSACRAAGLQFTGRIGAPRAGPLQVSRSY